MSTPKTAVEALIAARELISVPERWTQGVFEHVDVQSGAVCWCGLGAIRAVTGPDRYYYTHYFGLLSRAVQGDFVRWQDAPERTHAEVLAAFDKAIELARAEEA